MLPIFADIEPMLDLAERTWFDKRRVPTDREYKDALTLAGRDPKKSLSLARNNIYQKMLADRGITETPGEGVEALLPEQVAVINTYLNLADTRSLKWKLQDLGVSLRQFNAWMKFPPFKEYLEHQAQQLFAEGLPIAHRSLLDQVAKGDVRAIKLYYDKFGFGADLQNNQSQGEDVKRLLQSIVEVIQIHVTDQAQLQAIAADFERVLSGQKAIGR